MKKIPLYITSLFLVILIIPDITFGSRLDEIREYRKKINATENVNKLYSIRYGLGRIGNEGDLNVDEKRELAIALKSLSTAFAEKNHYRNAADVLFDYLALKGELSREYEVYLKDSVSKSFSTIAAAEMEQLNKLESELKKLRGQQEVIVGIRNKYYTFGGIALGILLSAFGYLLWQQLNQIGDFRHQLIRNRQQLHSLYRESVESRMTGGGIAFAENISATGIALLEEMGEQKPPDVMWDIIMAELHSLRKSTEA